MDITLNKPILELNDRLAAENRALLDERGIYMLDLLASPGAGKTSVILATLEALGARFNMAVIEGDIASDVDSQRVRQAGVPAVQINTGGACHLEAAMIRRALDALDLDTLDLIIVENVGNLVCPTDFYLGEDAKAMILSVPEGDDKPLKYPGVFQVARAIILNKIDTLPVFDFSEEAFRAHIARLNPQAPVFALSAVKHQGLDAWAEWLTQQVEARKVNSRRSRLQGSQNEASDIRRVEGAK